MGPKRQNVIKIALSPKL